MDQEPQPARINLDQVQFKCIRCRAIDSWHKLHVLLWLYEHRDLRLTCQELAGRLYLGDLGMLQAMLRDLLAAGFLTAEDGYCVLSETPEIQACVTELYRSFADPLARQEIIERIRLVGAPDAER